jgi:hypothetical protein
LLKELHATSPSPKFKQFIPKQGMFNNPSKKKNMVPPNFNLAENWELRGSNVPCPSNFHSVLLGNVGQKGIRLLLQPRNSCGFFL